MDVLILHATLTLTLTRFWPKVGGFLWSHRHICCIYLVAIEWKLWAVDRKQTYKQTDKETHKHSNGTNRHTWQNRRFGQVINRHAGFVHDVVYYPWKGVKINVLFALRATVYEINGKNRLGRPHVKDREFCRCPDNFGLCDFWDFCLTLTFDIESQKWKAFIHGSNHMQG